MTTKRHRILLVDDHAMIRRALRAALDAQEDFVVEEEAEDGAEAMRMLNELRPDVVVMDVGLPDMSGTDVTRLMKAAWPRVQVVLTSAHVDDALPAEAAAAGAHALVAKHEVMERLVAAVRAAALRAHE